MGLKRFFRGLPTMLPDAESDALSIWGGPNTPRIFFRKRFFGAAIFDRKSLFCDVFIRRIWGGQGYMHIWWPPPGEIPPHAPPRTPTTRKQHGTSSYPAILTGTDKPWLKRLRRTDNVHYMYNCDEIHYILCTFMTFYEQFMTFYVQFRCI